MGSRRLFKDILLIWFSPTTQINWLELPQTLSFTTGEAIKSYPFRHSGSQYIIRLCRDSVWNIFPIYKMSINFKCIINNSWTRDFFCMAHIS